jgi:hypothetical protein
MGAEQKDHASLPEHKMNVHDRSKAIVSRGNCTLWGNVATV